VSSGYDLSPLSDPKLDRPCDVEKYVKAEVNALVGAGATVSDASTMQICK